MHYFILTPLENEGCVCYSDACKLCVWLSVGQGGFSFCFCLPCDGFHRGKTTLVFLCEEVTSPVERLPSLLFLRHSTVLMKIDASTWSEAKK